MDIKGVARSILPFGISGSKEAQGTGTRVKTETTDERDGNGQSAGEQQRKRRNLSEEEILEAVKYLESLPGVKDNFLAVRVERNAEGLPSVLIVDRAGKTVRRIPESEISLITTNKSQKNGHLLNRAL